MLKDKVARGYVDDTVYWNKCPGKKKIQYTAHTAAASLFFVVVFLPRVVLSVCVGVEETGEVEGFEGGKLQLFLLLASVSNRMTSVILMWNCWLMLVNM